MENNKPNVIRLSSRKIDVPSLPLVSVGGVLRPILPETTDLRAPSKSPSTVNLHSRAKAPTPLARATPRSSKVANTAHTILLFPFLHGGLTRVVALFLVPLLLVYPIAPVYADEGEPTTVAPSDTTAPEQTPPVQVEESTPVVETPALPDSSVETDSPQETTTEDPGNETESSPGDAPPSDDPSSHTGPSAESSNEGVSEDVASSTDTVSSVVGGSSNEGDIASSTDATSSEESFASSTNPEVVHEEESNVNADLTSEESSSTDEVVAMETSPAPSETPEMIVSRLLAEREAVLRNNLRKEIESEYTKGCVVMDNVGYYCLKESDRTTSSTEVAPRVTHVDVGPVSGSPYKQVIMTKGDMTETITHDDWDNAFPASDVSGRSIVWQGNVNDRWQIFFADTSGTGTPTIVQVTHSSESNFNPRVEGHTIVWQGWVNGNWEIYLAELLPPAERLSVESPLPEENVRLGIDGSWHVERITTNDEHDMFPSIAGGLVTWQSFQDGSWNVYMYSLTTKTVAKVSRDGVKSENPRFSVTWDERGADGQTRMMGYDIATGKVVDITSEARQVPDDTKPYQPQAPLTQTNQAALPSGTGTSTGTTTPSRGDGDDTGNGLDI